MWGSADCFRPCNVGEGEDDLEGDKDCRCQEVMLPNMKAAKRKAVSRRAMSSINVLMALVRRRWSVERSSSMMNEMKNARELKVMKRS